MAGSVKSTLFFENRSEDVFSATMVAPFLVPFIFIILGRLLKLKELPSTRVDVHQRRAYECGFSAFQSARRPFSVYFFLVGLLFVVFDVELIFLMPLPFLTWLRRTMCCGLGLFFFILVFGLYHE